MDISAFIPATSFVIDGYGEGQFCVRGTWHTGAQIVFADAIQPWPVGDFASLSEADFAPVLERAGQVDLLLFGTGPRNQMLPKAVRQSLRAAGIVVEGMDTGAACRTYNVLLAEGRRVVAAVLPV